MNNLGIDVSDISVINEFSSDSEDFVFSHTGRMCDGFVYFTEGQGSYSVLGGESYEIKDSTLVLLKKGDSYSFSVKAGYRYIVSAYNIVDSENMIGLLPKVLPCTQGDGIIISNIYKSWEQRKDFSPMSCKIHILSLYLELFKRYLSKDHSDPVIRCATDFIHTNFKRCFSSSELSDFCKISESYLRAKFKETLGMTITEYRDKMRIEEAKRMLCSLIFTVKEIASELGYTDVYHFTKAFKQKTGISPAKYARSFDR